MKKTRLLEIIREEISSALREGDAEDKAAQMAALKATDLEIKALQKKKAEMMKTGVAETQLNEIEQLAEMASMVQLKTQLEKQGKTDKLEAVKAAEKATIDQLRQNPVFSGEGKDVRLKGYVSALKKELKNTHNINLQDLLTDVMLDAEAAGDKFKDDIASNTIEKDAAAQILGTEKGQRGRKSSEKSTEKEPKATEPKATETDKATSAASKTPKLDKLANDKDSLLKALKQAEEERLKTAEKRRKTEDVAEREKLLDDLKRIGKLEGELKNKLANLGF
jgi:hypothetical protein